MTAIDVCLALTDERNFKGDALEVLAHFRRLAEQALKDSQVGGTLMVTSMVGANDGAPMVRLSWGPVAGELTPAEARAHGSLMYESAEAAETDALLFEWVATELKGDKRAGAVLVHKLRNARLLRREREGG